MLNEVLSSVFNNPKTGSFYQACTWNLNIFSLATLADETLG